LRQQPIGVASAKSLPQLKPQQGPPPVPGRARQSLSPHPSSSRQRIAKQTNSRAGLKHIGGYFDRKDVEKVAVLRARLELDKAGWADCAVLRAVDRLNRLAAFSYLHETGEGAASTVTES
jgi:hypothetical protein